MSDLSELVQDYGGQLELEKFLVDFVAWLGEKDIYFAEPLYEEIDFNIEAWAFRKWPHDTMSSKGECPTCETDEWRFLSNDYMCLRCRALDELFKQDMISGGWTGVDDFGNELTWEDPFDNYSYPIVRQPIDGQFKPALHPVSNLAYHYLRYKAEREPSFQTKPKVGEIVEVPF